MRAVFLAVALTLPGLLGHALDNSRHDSFSGEDRPLMPEPTPPPAAKPPAPRKPAGLIRRKVKELVPAPVQATVGKSVAVATATVKVPFRFLKNTLFLVRTELKGKLLLHLPSIDVDPNRGVTYGVLPVLLVPDMARHDGPARIRTIFAPSVTYNRIFGITATARLVHFYDRWRQLAFNASLSERTNHAFSVYYADEQVFERSFLELRAASDRDGSYRFYGIGPDSRLDDQANYTRSTLGWRATWGQPVARHCSVGVHHRLDSVNISDGPIRKIPELSARFPALTPADQITLAWYRLYASYDSRDSGATPTNGKYVNLFWEIAPKGLLSDRNMTAWGGDGRLYFRHHDDFVFTPRLRFQAVKGTDIPFFALSRLGGKEALRGYGDGRFVDKGMFTAGLEERWTGFKSSVMGTPVEFETGPFVEAGQVFPHLADIDRRHTRSVGGFFLRGVSRPQLVASFDAGFGREGAALFMDVSYSW